MDVHGFLSFRFSFSFTYFCAPAVAEIKLEEKESKKNEWEIFSEDILHSWMEVPYQYSTQACLSVSWVSVYTVIISIFHPIIPRVCSKYDTPDLTIDQPRRKLSMSFYISGISSMQLYQMQGTFIGFTLVPALKKNFFEDVFHKEFRRA